MSKDTRRDQGDAKPNIIILSYTQSYVHNKKWDIVNVHMDITKSEYLYVSGGSVNCGHLCGLLNPNI